LIVYLYHYRSGSNAALSVLVAQKLIQKGTTGDVIRTTSGLYQATSIPKSQVESGAIVDPATLSGQATTTDISPGQQLTASDFEATSTSSVVNQIGPGQRAVVVTLGSPEQVGGQIAAGSHVDAWVSGSNQSASNGSNTQSVVLLYQNLYVLGINGGNVTFRVTPVQAGRLIWASQNATIYLALRPTVGTPANVPAINNLGR
jgi:Flp pilus assembly protein CpaB